MLEPRATVVIKTARVSRLVSGYPWVAKEDVIEVIGKPETLVSVQGQDGRSAGVATYNPDARFALRILDRTVQPITIDWFRARLREAGARRLKEDSNSERVLFAEADGVPGLIVDRFDRWLVLQVRSLGMEKLKSLWLPALVEELQPEGILERSDMEGRAEEGLASVVGTLYGEVPDTIDVIESGLTFRSPTRSGLKTGFYLDQRDARRKLESLTKSGERVLDVCCYTGGFALYAARAGAEATGIDILPEAIEVARTNAQLNGLAARFIQANAFEWLASDAATYDTILLDPPAIAKTGSEKESLRSAIYKLCDLALPRLRKGGRLVVFSCSYQMGVEGLIDVVRSVGIAHKRAIVVDDITLQPSDHPYLAQFPESLYLKGVWCRAL
jgi:23S rRNA (cytosine1962-C5)-methyltransferase